MSPFLRRFAALCCVFAVLLSCSAAFAVPTMPEIPSQEILSAGDFGEDVETLQTELRALGFYEGEITGLFDGATKQAVIRLQAFLGVREDGAFGPLTFAAYWNAFELGLLAFPEQQSAASDETDRLAGYTIGIDPGHQETPDAELEQMAPGVKRTKERQSPGSTGVKTGVPEYKINLLIAFKLRDLLEAEGATVVLTRETSDFSLSNMERALLMNESGVDIWLRLHCDSVSSANKSGASVLIPSRAYGAAIYQESLRLGQCVYESFSEATGATMISLRALALMDQTGFNWSEKPVIAVEMGMLSNPQEDIRLNRDSYQTSCAAGLFNGILAYFEQSGGGSDENEVPS